MTHYRQTNGLIHEHLPEFHWLSPISKVQLTEQNASEYGYELAENHPEEYAVWLVGFNAKLRAEAYRVESDPLFFKWQRGEIEQQVWLDKVAEIKARYT
jgi:hypothetical protein